MEKFIVPCSTDGGGDQISDSIKSFIEDHKIADMVRPAEGVHVSDALDDAPDDTPNDAPDDTPVDAPDDTLRAIVGGVEYVVGGWALHAANRRRYRAEASGVKPGALYSGRTYVYPDDAVNSITADTWETPGVLRAALLHLADALGRLEDRLCEPDEDSVWECGRLTSAVAQSTGAGGLPPMSIGIPSLTSTDLRLAAANSALGADPDALRDLADAALEVAAVVGEVLPPLPQIKGLMDFPDHPIRVADDEAVLRLEAAVVPHLATLEQYQAALATRLDEVAAAVARMVTKLDAAAAK